ncbi:hypothetical protein MBLNU459_g3631t1 [Dothideomycetes sp. NU459]
MSHVPFVAIAPELEAESPLLPSIPALDADDLRAPSDRTAVGTSSISATSALSEKMSSRRGRVPSWIGLPAAIVTSLGLSAVAYSFVPDLAGFELAAVSRSLNEPWQIAALLAWKVAELVFAWTAGLDYYDFTSLSVLANIPYYVLLYVFYATPVLPLALGFAIDITSLALPFYLLRPLNFHNALNSTSAPGSTNELAADRSVQFYMTLLAASIYSLIVYTSFYTWLPVYMITYFDEVRSLEAAHNAVMPILFFAFIPIGNSAKDFLFSSSIAASRGPGSVAPKRFNPRAASLSETVLYNFGLASHSSREAVLSRRTLILVLFSAANTFVRVFGTVEGTEIYGAAGWAGLWSAAALTVGIAFRWAGDA